MARRNGASRVTLALLDEAQGKDEKKDEEATRKKSLFSRFGSSKENKSPVTPKNLGQLIKLICVNEISGKIAKDVLEDMFSSGKTAQEIVNRG